MDSPLIVGLRVLGQPSMDMHAQPNLFAVQGEAGTGFEKAGSLGEFECGNCKFFDAAAGACDQTDMKQVSKQPRLADGRVVVSDEDCCEYVWRIGRKDKDNGSK